MTEITADIITNMNTFKGFVAMESNVNVIRPKIVNRPIESSIKAIVLIMLLIIIDNNIPYLHSKTIVPIIHLRGGVLNSASQAVSLATNHPSFFKRF